MGPKFVRSNMKLKEKGILDPNTITPILEIISLYSISQYISRKKIL